MNTLVVYKYRVSTECHCMHVIIIVAIYKKTYWRIHNEIESAGTVKTDTYIHIWLSLVKWSLGHWNWFWNNWRNKCCQNVLITSHSQIQWKNVPLCFWHLKQISGISGLKLFNFSGVTYVRITQLYWISLNLVLIDRFWALTHIWLHSESGRSYWKSIPQAILLDSDDSLELFTKLQ
jgi:hypothetical protein